MVVFIVKKGVIAGNHPWQERYIPGQIWHLTHRCRWVGEYLDTGGNNRDDKWTKSIAPYSAHFDIKNEDIGANNTYYWDINNEYSIR